MSTINSDRRFFALSLYNTSLMAQTVQGIAILDLYDQRPELMDHAPDFVIQNHAAMQRRVSELFHSFFVAEGVAADA